MRPLGYRTCPYCDEVFDPRDRDARARRAGGWRKMMWFCSSECRERYARRAAGEETPPYPGEVLEEGFALLQAAERPDW